MTLRPPIFVPRPYDEPDWYSRPRQVNFALLNSVKPPIHRLQQREHFTDDEPFWQWNPPRPNFGLLNSIQPPNRRLPREQRYTDDEPFWQWNPHRLIALLNVPFQPGRRVSYDDDTPWQWDPPRNNSLLAPAVVTNPPIANRRQFGADDDTPWSRPLPYLPPLLNSTKPFVPITRQLGQDDDTPWQRAPSRLIALLNAPFVAPVRGFGYDDDTPWLRIPQRLVALLQPVVTAQPPTVRRWNFNIDDDTPWQLTLKTNAVLYNFAPGITTPGHWSSPSDEPDWQRRPQTNIAITSTPAAPPPPIHARWNFNNDDDTPWQQTPKVNLVLYNTTFLLIPPGHWVDTNDQPDWQRPQPTNIALLAPPTVANPFINRHDFGLDDADGWYWKPPFNLSIVVAQGFVHVPSGFWVSPDDTSEWQRTPPLNLALTQTVVVTNPFIKLYPQFNYDAGESYWEWVAPRAWAPIIPPPPPPGHVFEWLTRARRRGRR